MSGPICSLNWLLLLFLNNGQKISVVFVVGQDIPATILDICGVDVPSSYQGSSLCPLINGKKTDWRKDVFLENLFTQQSYPRQEGVRDNQFKYIRSFSKVDDRDLSYRIRRC